MPYDRKDKYYQQAKKDGYASRAAYKLKELNAAFKLVKKGDTVIELGAWPGGWTQVLLQLVGPKGKIIACDLKAINLESSNLSFYAADIFEEQTKSWCVSESNNSCNCLVSDMSAKLTGIKFADQAQSAELATRCLEIAKETLADGGNMVVKIFPGDEERDFFMTCKKYFKQVKRKNLESSRNSSNEIYIVCLGLKND